MIDAIVFFFCALLTGLGIGSGGLLIVFLSEVSGLSQLSAGSINLIFFMAASSFSTVVNFIKHRILHRELLILAVAGSLGSVAGSFFASSLGESLLKKLFGGLLIFMGALLLLSRRKK